MDKLKTKNLDVPKIQIPSQMKSDEITATLTLNKVDLANSTISVKLTGKVGLQLKLKNGGVFNINSGGPWDSNEESTLQITVKPIAIVGCKWG